LLDYRAVSVELMFRNLRGNMSARGPIDSRPDTREPRRLGAAGLRSPSHMLENVHGTEGAMKETHPTEQVFRARKGPRLEGRKRDNCPE